MGFYSDVDLSIRESVECGHDLDTLFAKFDSLVDEATILRIWNEYNCTIDDFADMDSFHYGMN